MNHQKTAPKTFQTINILALVLVLVMNILSTVLPINGRSVQEISDALPSYFTPAGYTFSIWGLIYTALLAFTIYQALPAQRERPFLAQIGWLFMASSVANSLWLVAWHYEQFLLSLILIVGVLVTLIAIYRRLGIGRYQPDVSTAEKLLVQVPFSLYLGWLTVATIANTASVLNYWGWDGFGVAQPTWSAVMMGVAVVVAGGVLVNRRSLAYAGVLIWALFGIRAAYPEVAVVANTAVLAAVLILGLALLGYWRTQPAPPRLDGVNFQA